MKFIGVLTALLLATGPPALAQQQNWAFVGFGDSSCGSWTDAREKNTSFYMEDFGARVYFGRGMHIARRVKMMRLEAMA